MKNEIYKLIKYDIYLKRMILLLGNRNRNTTCDIFLSSNRRWKEWEDIVARMSLPTVRPPYVISVYEIRLQ